jgi:ATP-dependent RNA helicase DeaD
MATLEKFRELGLSDNILEALEKKGFEEPSEIQAKTIPLLLQSNRDIIGQAQTGTGKTAAFGLPIIEKIQEKQTYVQALVLTPTRELTIQVAAELNSLKGNKRLKIVPIYGGQSIEKQAMQLKRTVDIVVGTPGRIIDHLQRRRLDLSKLEYMILDEADEMLNIGFIEEIEKILSKTNPDKQTLLFSATMPQMIVKLAEKYMNEYDIIRTKTKHLTTNLTDQIYFEVRESDKLEALCRIIDIEDEFYGLIFCRTKRDVDEITEKLIDRGYDVDSLHGDLSQHQRERIMDKFRKKHCNILIATDVASRGLDITELTHVINFALPQDTESYIHRIGRTGRAGKQGTAITFITPSEYRKLARIKKTTKTDIRKETVPTIKNIIENRKKRIENDIRNMIGSELEQEYIDIANSLLEENDPAEALGSLLKIAFEHELNENSYNEIKDVSIDRKGTTRLFVARGKLDRINARQLVDHIEEKSKVFGKRIQDIKIYDKFSFITVSFSDAETILKAFRPSNSRERALIERAKN